MATLLGMMRAKLRIRLQSPNMYLCFAWSYMILLFVCLFMFDEMLYNIFLYDILYCLLKSFPNCHSVCHPNKYVCTPFQQLVGGSNHGSPVFIRFGYPVANSPTHSLKSLDHFLLTVRDKPCCSNQRIVHYITSWDV